MFNAVTSWLVGEQENRLVKSSTVLGFSMAVSVVAPKKVK
ncbi:hypothetical protein NIES4102_24170 [Chondrocystis sp. NIES-4102]|nr:hypothetical protein NIES4102_24170 [Chondrocystis sp. NIES-4102]